MKLFYLLLVHKDLDHVARMIDALEHPEAVFFLHIDAKVPIEDISRSELSERSAVHFIIPRLNIRWGGFNIVKATLSLMQAAAERQEKGYFILLSGQDFPLVPGKKIFQHLERTYGTEYLEHWHIPYNKWGMSGGMDRLLFNWYIDEIGMTQSFAFFEKQKEAGQQRKLPEGLEFYGGSQWWCFTYECVKYILDVVEKDKPLTRFFRYSYIPDEMFFHTLVMNAPFRDNVKNNNLRFIRWYDNTPSPRVLVSGDRRAIIASGKFWARKFHSAQSQQLLDTLEKRIKRSPGTYTGTGVSKIFSSFSHLFISKS